MIAFEQMHKGKLISSIWNMKMLRCKALSEIHAAAQTVFQLEFIRKLGLQFFFWKPREMRNVDEAVFSKVL